MIMVRKKERIHPTAVIDPRAELDSSVRVGPYATIGPNVRIGADTEVMASAHVTGWTTIGRKCRIHMGAVVGHEPQDRDFGGGESYTVIGDRNEIREYATIHRGTKEGSSTVIGNDNLFMALSHVAHNCRIGDRVVICNGVLLAGYVEVGDGAILSGCAVVHQFTRIGRLVMIGGASRVAKDVPPFMLLEGDSTVRGLNTVGLRRAGYSTEKREEIKAAFRTLYRSGLLLSEALRQLEAGSPGEEVREIVNFIHGSQRGICKHA